MLFLRAICQEDCQAFVFGERLTDAAWWRREEGADMHARYLNAFSLARIQPVELSILRPWWCRG